MEWLKNKSLKQSFFIISILYLCAGLLLSTVSFLLCVRQLGKIEVYPSYELSLDENNSIISSGQPADFSGMTDSNADSVQIILLNIFQFVLPVFFVILSLLLAAVTFYRLKLKKPLAILQSSARRMQQQDLDFEIKKLANDEIGLLCDAFESMRIELLKNNQTLWRQMEERKRLNAAFSHDLRNPVTVLKGSVKLAKLGVGSATAGQLMENLNRIEDYTGRIEQYVETMSSVQRLEQIAPCKSGIAWSVLVTELESTLRLIGLESDKTLQFEAAAYVKTISLDKSILFQIAENLVTNALRFARHSVCISCSIEGTKLKLTVTDDGGGFSPIILKNGVMPFQKGGEEASHFGMGLYICELLCQKHGGSLVIGNGSIGASVCAFLKIS